MSQEAIGVIGLLALFVLMFAGMHLAFALMLTGFAGLVLLSSFNGAVAQLGLTPYSAISSYTLSVIPLFVLMGYFASDSGVVEDAFGAVREVAGDIKGGLAMATIGACAMFAACTGSSTASVATMAKVAYPEMRRNKYNDAFSTGTIAAGSTLGILIPPSIPFMVYGVITQQSIGKLFMAGVFPGILLTSLFILTILVAVRVRPELAPPGPSVALLKRIIACRHAWLAVVLVGIVMGGIWGGIFTASEAGAMGAFVAFVIALLRRRLNRQNFLATMKNTMSTTAMIFALVIGATIFGNFLTMAGLPAMMVEFIKGLALPPVAVLTIILIIYLFLGCIMDALSITLITIPIVFPVIVGLGIDPILFGVLFVINTEMALITPPVGMNVFILGGMVKHVPMYKVFKGSLIFLAAMVACTIIVIAFPDIALFLPRTMVR